MSRVIKMHADTARDDDRFWSALRARVDDAVGAGEDVSLDEAEARMAVAGEEPVDPVKVAAVVREVVAVDAAVARGRAPVRVLRMPFVRAAVVVLGVVLAVAGGKWLTDKPTSYEKAVRLVVDNNHDVRTRYEALVVVQQAVTEQIALLKAVQTGDSGDLAEVARLHLAEIRAALVGSSTWQARRLRGDWIACAEQIHATSSALRREALDVLLESALYGVLSLRHAEKHEGIAELRDAARATVWKLRQASQ